MVTTSAFDLFSYFTATLRWRFHRECRPDGIFLNLRQCSRALPAHRAWFPNPSKGPLPSLRSRDRPNLTPSTSSSSCRKIDRLTMRLERCVAFAASTTLAPCACRMGTQYSYRRMLLEPPLRRGDWTSRTRKLLGWVPFLTQGIVKSMRGTKAGTTVGLKQNAPATMSILLCPSRWDTTRGKIFRSITPWPIDR